MNAIIYLRVSTKEQVEVGYSLAHQEKSCLSYAERNNLNVLRVFSEKGESAKTANRTELKNMEKFVMDNSKNIDALIVYKLDRLTRSVPDSTDLMRFLGKYRIELHSATENIDDTPIGRYLKNILFCHAEFENDIKKERTKNGMMQAVKEGRWCWRPPFAYKSEKDYEGKPTLIPTDEADYVSKIFNLAASGYSQSEISRMLRTEGFNKASKGFINRILYQPLYASLIKIRWDDNYIPAKHEPIISREIFFRVREMLESKRPQTAKKLRSNPDFPLKKTVACFHCSKNLTAGWSKNKVKKRYGYYRCHSKECSFNIGKDVLEGEFCKLLKSMQPKKECLELFKDYILHAWSRKEEERINNRKKLETELKMLEERRSRIDDLIINGTMNEESYQRNSEQVNAEIKDKKIQLKDVAESINLDVEDCLNYCERFLSDLAGLWRRADFFIRQRLQSVIFPEKIYFDKETFETPKTSLIFNYLSAQKSLKVSFGVPNGI